MKTVKLDPDFGDAWAYFFRFDHPLNVIHTFTLYITKYWFWVLSDFFRLFSQPQLPIRQETHPGCSHFFLMWVPSSLRSTRSGRRRVCWTRRTWRVPTSSAPKKVVELKIQFRWGECAERHGRWLAATCQDDVMWYIVLMFVVWSFEKGVMLANRSRKTGLTSSSTLSAKIFTHHFLRYMLNKCCCSFNKRV